MNIQDLEQKYKELGAEIERLKQQPEGVWEPKRGDYFFMIDFHGAIRSINPMGAVTTHHNIYKTRQLAEKASVLMRRSNLIIQACLNFDPDFEPDWSKKSCRKFGFHYDFDCREWACFISAFDSNNSCAYVSTREIADKVVDYLNRQEIK